MYSVRHFPGVIRETQVRTQHSVRTGAGGSVVFAPDILNLKYGWPSTMQRFSESQHLHATKVPPMIPPFSLSHSTSTAYFGPTVECHERYIQASIVIHPCTVMTEEISTTSVGSKDCKSRSREHRCTSRCDMRSVRLAEYPGVQAKTMDLL